MQIKNNNHLTFGAYFKNNRILKDAYCQEINKIDHAILDKFTKECPNHEIEILTNTTEHPKDKYYRIFNNMTNKVANVYVQRNQRSLDVIMRHLLELVNLDEVRFWEKDSITYDFNLLTGVK